MNYRNLFDGIEQEIKLKDGRFVIPINFDNGATTPPLKSTVDLINENIKYYGPIARGIGFKGEYCTDMFEKSRETILNFFNLKKNSTHTVIYTKSDTESLNILANILIKDKDDIVLTTRMEHHANDLPFRNVGQVNYIDVDKNGRINLDDIQQSLIKANGKIKIVTVTGASNVTGYINPIYDIAKLAHRYNALIIVDAAQLVAHRKINIVNDANNEVLDFVTFSAHKAYAPFGSGAIVGLKDYLNDLDPLLTGGGCVSGVFDNKVIYSPIPERFESGTQNFFGIISMAKALEDLQKIGFENIQSHEKRIKEYLIKNMKSIPGVILYGDTENIDDRLGVIPFNIENLNYEEAGEILADNFGISLRCGKFCAHPYVFRLLGVKDYDAYRDIVNGEYEYGMIRASLGLYNTIKEAKIFLNALEDIAKNSLM